jgi:hypothetical protein
MAPELISRAYFIIPSLTSHVHDCGQEDMLTKLTMFIVPFCLTEDRGWMKLWT